MHTRKHTGGPRRRNRKAILILALILLLGMAIGGTVAYLSDSTGDVENSLTPATVVGIIEETVRDNAKTSITVKNEGNVACYVRVALVTNWVNEDGDICTLHNDPGFTLGSGWTQGEDGYYYHTNPVKPGKSTSNLLGDKLVMTQAEDGCTMQVEILSSVIQTNADAYASWSTK
jgi:predicted ribosomally synthesized peptide with SipW-like signal peptide